MNQTIVANREIINAVPAPPRTKTWGVVPHHSVLNAMDTAIAMAGARVSDERYEMARDGSKMFAVWQLDGEGLIRPTVGFRNSMDKSMSFAIVAGSMVTVCSNGQFSGEYMTYRKHTGSFDVDTAIEFASGSVIAAVKRSSTLIEWQESLKEVGMTRLHSKAFRYDLLEAEILGVKALARFDQCLKEEQAVAREYDYDATSLYSHHGAVTRMSRDLNIRSVINRTRNLEAVTDWYRKAA